MGTIVKTKNLSPTKITISFELTRKEAQALKGNCKNIHLFSEDLCVHYTETIERGVKKSAKYVLIPRILRKRKDSRLSEIQYQKIETDSKIFYIMVTEKENNEKEH